ncbi:unnamed protein product, partial [Prorocentrum cordatum]
ANHLGSSSFRSRRPLARVLSLLSMGNICDRRSSEAEGAGAGRSAGGKAVVWLHGLGDTGDGWRGAFGSLRGVEFHHPTAPTRPVSCNSGMRSTSWFDIQDIPVDLSEPEGPRDMDTSVEQVHGMLRDLEAKGVPAGSIVLGGFSQGGAVSLSAGLSYPRALGGVVSISGWCVNREDVTSWMSEAGRRAPVLMCCGDGDPVVDFSITGESGRLLQEALGDSVQVLCPEREMHQPSREEMRAVLQFMQKQTQVTRTARGVPSGRLSRGSADECELAARLGLVAGRRLASGLSAGPRPPRMALSIKQRRSVLVRL